MKGKLILLVILGSNFVSAQITNLTSQKYYRKEGIRHTNLDVLTLNKDESFRIIQKNFKGTWRIIGNWKSFGDTLILYYQERNYREGHRYKKKNCVTDFEIEKLIIKFDGFYLPSRNNPTFYTKKAWKNGGKHRQLIAF